MGDPEYGREEWLRDAMLEHLPMVYRLAHGVLGNAADAEDATQTTFLELARRPDAHLVLHSPRAYLARMALNSARKLVRAETAHHARKQVWLERRATTARGEETVIDREQVWATVDELPETLRVPVVLHYREGLKYREIAEALDWPEGTVARRLSSAKERLRTELERKGAVAGVVGIGAVEPALAALPRAEVPAGLGARVLAQVEAQVGGNATAEHATPARRAPRPPRAIGAPALAGILLLAVTASLIAWRFVDPAGSKGDGAPRETARIESDGDVAPPSAATTDGVGDGIETAARPNGKGEIAPAPDAIPPTATRGRIHGIARTTGGRVIADASVRLLLSPTRGVVASTRTDSNGSFEFLEPSPRRWPDLLGGDDREPATVVPESVIPETVTPEAATTARSVDWFEPAPPFRGQTLIMSPNGFEVEIVATGYLPARAGTGWIQAGGSRRVDLELETSSIFTARVVGGGRPVVGARVEAIGSLASTRTAQRWFDLPEEVTVSHTDAQGRFQLDSLPAGDYAVRVSAAGWQTREEVLSSRRTEHPDIELDPAGSLEIEVRHARRSMPIENATVRIYSHDAAVAEGTTDAAGRWTAVDLAPGSYDARIYRSRAPLPVAHAKAEVRASEITPVTIATTEGRDLIVHLTVPAELAELNFALSLYWDDGIGAPQQRHTSSHLWRGEREFAFTGLPVGRYLARLHGTRGKGFAGSTLGRWELELPEGEGTFEMEIEAARPEASFEVEVSDERGRPVMASLALFHESDGGFNADELCDEDGRAVLFAFPGHYRLEVSAAGGYRPRTVNALDLRPGEHRAVAVRLEAGDPSPVDVSSAALSAAGSRRIRIRDLTTYRTVIDLIDAALDEVTLRVDPALESSGRLIRQRVAGPYEDDAAIALVTLFAGNGYRLERRGDEVWIIEDRD